MKTRKIAARLKEIRLEQGDLFEEVHVYRREENADKAVSPGPEPVDTGRPAPETTASDTDVDSHSTEEDRATPVEQEARPAAPPIEDISQNAESS